VNSSQTQAASYRYDPFGNTISQSGSLATANVYRFSSKEIHDASGLYYYTHRWYAPNLQRWLNRDPVGELGFVRLLVVSGLDQVKKMVQMLQFKATVGHQANLYDYVLNNPLNQSDPLGLEPALPPGWHGPGQPYDPSSNPFGGPPPQNPCKGPCPGSCSKGACVVCCVAGTTAGNMACGNIPNFWAQLACRLVVNLTALACAQSCANCPNP
jgi:RHS repeat-associated protein